jgi:hypothetical protein
MEDTMCARESNQFEVAPSQPEAAVAVITPPARGSRRRRLWEFEGFAHCPVIGVCLPIANLRRLVSKLCGVQPVADDYDLHCGAIAECKQRSALAEAVQRELDRRFAVAIKQSAKVKTTEALSEWWGEASRGDDLAAVFWATLTHPRCSPDLEHQVLGQVHMLQHQVGMAQRVDLQRFETLLAENATLARELGQAQQRSARQAAELTRRSDAQQGQVMQLRAQLIARDTSVMALKADLQTLEAAVPGLKGRVLLERETQQQAERIHALERALLQAQQACERQARRVQELTEELARRDDANASIGQQASLPDIATTLGDRAVLCVGGRPASVPLYRHIVEGTGGRFLHHDGGEEESVAKLDATLAAADLVICQTGCISHNAYWRVKDHCKRTGKQCVFVENPGSASLKRALAELQPADKG